MMIDYKKIHGADDPLLKNVENTYIASFPEAERRAVTDFTQLVDNEPRFNVYALLNEGKYIGFITTWRFDSFAYIEHFAIDESARNGGFGSLVMKRFIEKLSLPIVLEVELPTDEMSIRRVGFYERLGFTFDHHEYLQPPYRKGDDWLPMRLMSIGGIDLSAHYETVRKEIYRFVYNQ